MLETLFTGQNLIQLEEVDSTNNYLKNIKDTLQEGAVVTAQWQSAGRGQQGGVWESKKGSNLLCSVLYCPNLELSKQVYLNMSVALAVKSCVEHFIPNKEITIKWPNDIYVSGNKIAGILIENSIQDNLITQSVIGIGINVNENMPSSLHATSLLSEMGMHSKINEVLEVLLKQLEVHYLRLKKGQYPVIKNEYIAHLYRFGDNRMYRDMNSNLYFLGKIKDVNDEGKLIIETLDGLRLFGVKEVEFLR